MDDIIDAKKAVRSHALRSGIEDTPFDVHTREIKGQQTLPNRAQPEVPDDGKPVHQKNMQHVSPFNL